MMDYYSEFPAPPNYKVIHEVSLELYKKYPQDTLNVEMLKLQKYIKQSLEDMGGHSRLGSYTGYIVFGKHDLIQRTLAKIRTCSKEQSPLEEYLKVDTDSNMSASNGGNGFLPPIGSKRLDPPIKHNLPSEKS